MTKSDTCDLLQQLSENGEHYFKEVHLLYVLI